MMNKFTLQDFFIFLFSALLSVLLYQKSIYFTKDISSTIFTTFLTLTAFFLSIASLAVNSWEQNVVKKLKESNLYIDLLITLKITNYSFIFIGSTAFLYSIFYDILLAYGLLVALSALLLLFSLASIGYLIKNIRRIFLILENFDKS